MTRDRAEARGHGRAPDGLVEVVSPSAGSVVPRDLAAAIRERGYCLVREALASDDVAAIKDRLREIAGQAERFRYLGVSFTPDPAPAPAAVDDPLARFEQIGNAPFRDPTIYARLLTHPAILRLATGLLGPDCHVVNAGFFVKHAGDGAEVPWHQDTATWGIAPGAWTWETAPRIFDFWLALDPTDRDNGCLCLLPGSERGGIVPHARRGGLLPEADPTANGLDIARAVALPAAPGDLVVYHQDMFHRSDANRSSRPRLAAAGTLVGTGDVARLRTLLPHLPTLARSPLVRAGRPVPLGDPLPARPAAARVAWRRLSDYVAARASRLRSRLARSHSRA